MKQGWLKPVSKWTACKGLIFLTNKVFGEILPKGLKIGVPNKHVKK
jgi:hypothetical protein